MSYRVFVSSSTTKALYASTEIPNKRQAFRIQSLLSKPKKSKADLDLIKIHFGDIVDQITAPDNKGIVFINRVEAVTE